MTTRTTTPTRTGIAPAALLFLTLALTAAAPAQIPADRDGLLNGEGMGMAAYAESNGYPGPKHVLDLAAKLELTAKQKHDVREVYDAMLERARAVGKMIVKVEEELHYQFNSGMLRQETVEEDAESIGRMRGTLRGVHLAAHVKTKELLTPKQVELYVALRKAEREKAAKPAGGEHKH